MKYHQKRIPFASKFEPRFQAYVGRLQSIRKSTLEETAKKRIVIVGAGMAGLSAAYELMRLGFEVTVLEAEKTHVGGRVRTLRHSDTGAYGELGAMRIPKAHSLTRLYVKEASLKLRKFVQSNDDTVAYIRRQRTSRSKEDIESLKKEFELTREEKSLSADDMWERAVIRPLGDLTSDECEDLYGKTFRTPRIQEYDSMTLQMAMQRADLSKGAIEYVSSVYGVGTYLDTAFTEHLREELEEVWISDFDEIVGGTDLLPSWLYEKVESHCRLGARVYRIEQSADHVTVSYQDGGIEEVAVQADYVLCTLPFGVLSTIDLTDAVSHDFQWAVSQVNYDSSTKILIRCKKRFWELDDNIYGGGSIWDSGLGHTWYPSDNLDQDDAISKAPAYMLASYTWGQHADRIGTIPNSLLKEYVVQELTRIHTTLEPDDIEQVVRWNWAKFTNSSGAFAFFKPGDQALHYEEMKRMQGRILFAGEHCSLTHSWIQGALESAVDAMELILKKVCA